MEESSFCVSLSLKISYETPHFKKTPQIWKKISEGMGIQQNESWDINETAAF